MSTRIAEPAPVPTISEGAIAQPTVASEQTPIPDEAAAAEGNPVTGEDIPTGNETVVAVPTEEATSVIVSSAPSPPATDPGPQPTVVSAPSTPVPTATPVPQPTAVTVIPASFVTLPPGSPLPSSEVCGAAVVRAGIEHRPENAAANRNIPQPLPVRIDGASNQFNARWASRIDGAFSGTTDEIIQWAACKWGFDLDLMRARAVEESSWRQSTEGDRTSNGSLCALLERSAPCAQSYGLFQVKGTVHEGTYPRAAQSTAFNADYALAWLRACFEGDFRWLGSAYSAGDLAGCVGAWFSGRWRDDGAQRYIARVMGHLNTRPWESPRF
jgi:autotransporter family porin